MSHQEVKLSDALHKEIANKLRFAGIEKERLDELVNTVAENIGSVLNSILKNVPNYTSVSYFPYGIIGPPDAYHVKVQIGGPQAGGGAF